MACFAVYLKATNKQIRVFHFDLFGENRKEEHSIAYNLAIDYVFEQHKKGNPCVVEKFTFSADIGYLVIDIEG